MTVLVVGGGGREHALVRMIKESPRVDSVHCCPGNGGIAYDAVCHNVAAMDIDGVVALAKEIKADLVVVAPDDPLVAGMVDALNAAGFATFGPRANAAIIEGSKVFSKDLMQKYHIPTAEYRVFDDPRAAIEYITEKNEFPTVIKADGLALSLNVEKNISIASLKKLSRRGLVSEKKAEENANTYVEKLQIKISGLEQQTKLLSGGNQQKVILARWMSCNPRILIFDEPTKGIDVGAKFEIYKLMNQLSDAGLGIILISSDLSEVIGMSDRVYVYREGHTVGELSHAEIEASNIMQYATGIKKQEGR